MEEKSKLVNLYENPKSKKFVNHLIQSYFPIYKITKVWDFEKEQKHKCVICNKSLFSIEEAFKNLAEHNEEIKKEFMPYLQKQINNEDVSINDNPFYKHITNGKAQALTGQKTNTCLCQKCIEELLQFVQIGLLNDDKNIVWNVKKMQRTEIFNTFKESPVLDEKEIEISNDIAKRAEKKKVITFGDLEVLKQLKEKMTKEEN